jgi:hypothetical protein
MIINILQVIDVNNRICIKIVIKNCFIDITNTKYSSSACMFEANRSSRLEYREGNKKMVFGTERLLRCDLVERSILTVMLSSRHVIESFVPDYSPRPPH